MHTPGTILLSVVTIMTMSLVPAPAADAQELIHELRGNDQDALGSDVRGLGDVNGDGRADWIAAARGKAIVYSGIDGSELHVIPTTGVHTVGAAGDMNRDGRADFLVGTWIDQQGGTTRVEAYSGIDGSLLGTIQDTAGAFGFASGSAGDVDNDGRTDLIVGAPENGAGGFSRGTVSVYSGRDGSLLYRINGSSDFDRLGIDVRGLGDLDNDGHDDFAASAPGDDAPGLNAGKVCVYSGIDGSTLFSIHGRSSGVGLAFISEAGDFNGDGTPDILLGESGGAFSTASIHSGRDGSEIHRFQPFTSRDGLGSTLGNAGDINGDGTDDYIIGAPGARGDGGTDSGHARLFSGKGGVLLYNLSGTELLGRFGSVVDGAGGDVNGDGLADVLAATPGERSAQGTVRVFGGSRLFLNAHPRIVTAGDQLIVTSAQWTAGTAAEIRLTRIDGASRDRVLSAGAFGADGTFGFGVIVPANHIGKTFELQAVAYDAAGNEVRSRPEVIQVVSQVPH